MIAFLDGLAAEMRERAEPQSGFAPPYTTVHVGTVEGGTAMQCSPTDYIKKSSK